MASFTPAYVKLLESGELQKRVALAYEMLSNCEMCGHYCRVDRRSEKLGVCRTGERARLASFGPHLGEEDPLRGWRGSGTIFFAYCNLRCQYCQNYDISQSPAGHEVEPETIASVMLELQAIGCHNINFVSPTHVIPPILAATLIAAQAGFRLPIVYNTGGYDSLEALALLDGVVDIYMPDMKYANARTGQIYSKARNYPQVNQQAVREMHRQVGDLVLDERGIAQRGLLVRHLVLPGNAAGTEKVASFLAEQVSKDTYINVMDQYRPAYRARQYDRLSRPVKWEEYQKALEVVREAGLYRLDKH